MCACWALSLRNWDVEKIAAVWERRLRARAAERPAGPAPRMRAEKRWVGLRERLGLEGDGMFS